MSIEAGVLYVVATPIGNLQDMGGRALEVLRQVDGLLVEDSRHTSKLLRHYGIDKPMTAVHEHNERELCPRIAARLEAGETLALVSDAGTPLVSDPGYNLVHHLRQRGLRVVPVPGPSALLAALSCAGLPAARFAFEGFLPARAAARDARLQALAREPRTLVFYESPRRALETLDAMARCFGPEREAAVARELTKAFEDVRGGTLTALAAWYRAHPERLRGEFVILTAGAEPGDTEADVAEQDRVLGLLLAHLPASKAAAVAARITGARKNALYRRALAAGQAEDEDG